MKIVFLTIFLITNVQGAMLVKDCNNLKEYVVKDPNSKDDHLCFMKVSCDVKRTGVRKNKPLESRTIKRQQVILSCNAKNSNSCIEPEECLKKNRIEISQRIGFVTEKELENEGSEKTGKQK